MADGALSEIITALARDRVMAHRVLFAHRHQSATPHFHVEMIEDFHFGPRLLCDIAFRGAAKSTLMEEGVIIRALFREFKNCKIFGETFDMAAQRLHAIRREFEKNERIKDIFGDVRAQPWADDKLELSTGVVIEAMGRGQSLRGTKEEIVRPDFIVLDDIESLESIRTPESREKVKKWLFSDVLPAGDVNPTVRMLSNDLHPECIANDLSRPGSGFKVKRYPWVYLDPATGLRKATWPERFPLEFIDETRTRLYAIGRAAEYEREYMCRSESAEEKPFKQEMFRFEAISRTWQAAYAMFDPARTVSRNAATTGFACWSWIGNRLVVWDAWGRKLMPDEIVGSIFAVHDEYHPALIGVEEDGLNEFLMQPIRHEQVRRGVSLPVRAMRAPKGKLDFIRGLQPFFNAREIWFAKPMPDLQSQLLSFPSGLIDAPNALAYALKMRPGAPLYDDFAARHIAPELRPLVSKPVWLCVNATRGLVTAVMVQLLEGAVRIFADWVREGEPAAILADLLSEARLEAQKPVRLIVGPQHFDRYLNVGLVQAAKRIPVEVHRGGDPSNGRAEIRALLRRDTKDMPSVMIAEAARWTLNGFAGGYARALGPQGMLADYAEEGPYRILMEGLESFAAILRSEAADDESSEMNYGFTRDGVRYMTTAPHLRGR